MRIGIVILPDTRWPEAARRWQRAEEVRLRPRWNSRPTWLASTTSTGRGSAPSRRSPRPPPATMLPRRARLRRHPSFRHRVALARAAAALEDIAGGRCSSASAPAIDGYDATVLGEPLTTPRPAGGPGPPSSSRCSTGALDDDWIRVRYAVMTRRAAHEPARLAPAASRDAANGARGTCGSPRRRAGGNDGRAAGGNRGRMGGGWRPAARHRFDGTVGALS